MAKTIEVKDLDIYYDGVLAVQDVTMTIQPKAVTALIGPSGLREVDVPARAEPDARGDPARASTAPSSWTAATCMEPVSTQSMCAVRSGWSSSDPTRSRR